jgi:hypothetical protein
MSTISLHVSFVFALDGHFNGNIVESDFKYP